MAMRTPLIGLGLVVMCILAVGCGTTAIAPPPSTTTTTSSRSMKDPPMTDHASSAAKLIPFLQPALEAFLPAALGGWQRVSTTKPMINDGHGPEPALEVFVVAYARYVRDGVSAEVTVTDLVELGMSSVTEPPPLTTVVNEFGSTTFSRLDGRLLSRCIDPHGAGYAAIQAASGVSVAAMGRGEDLPQLVELIAQTDLPGLDKLVRPTFPSVANDAVDGLSQAIIAMAQRHWSERDPATGSTLAWEFRITPPIPSAWPVIEGTTLTWFLYAAAFDPQLSDGERVSGPWGRIESRALTSDAPLFVAMKAGLAPVGTQGVRPLAASESGRLDACSPDALLRSLYALATTWAGNQALMDSTLESYRFWARMNGVIAEVVLKHQTQFAKVLRQR
jgi:hypothetical protein